MHRLLIPASVLALSMAVTGAAQSAPAGSQAQSEAAKPAPQTQPPAPAASPAPPATASAAAPKDKASAEALATNKKKPKKVWTNGEIASGGGRISVVGDQRPVNNRSRTPGTSSESESQDAAYYRNRLGPLRQQVKDIDREIQQMKTAKGNVRENVEPQVQIREARKEKIQAQINEIEEDARRHGVTPGDLR